MEQLIVRGGTALITGAHPFFAGMAAVYAIRLAKAGYDLILG